MQLRILLTVPKYYYSQLKLGGVVFGGALPLLAPPKIHLCQYLLC